MFTGFDFGRAEQDGELDLSYSSENQSKMNDEKMREVCVALEAHPGIKALMLRRRAVTFRSKCTSINKYA